MELSDLKQLVAFDECGTLLQASKKLYISQPSLTRTMKRLEEEFKVPLFVRTKNHIELNENGKLAAGLAKKILEQSDDMVSLVRNLDRRNHTIYIGSCAPVPSFWLYERLTSAFPDKGIQSDMDSDINLLEGLFNGKYQFIILPYESRKDHLLFKKFGTEQLYFVFPKDHPYARKKEISFQEMDGENMLLFSDIGFWHELVKRHMPSSRFLVQTKQYDFNELTRVSILPFFATDVTLRLSPLEKDRVAVRIADKDALITYYVHSLESRREEFERILSR